MTTTTTTQPLDPINPDFLFGADPELFIFNPEGQPVPAGNFIPGTKKEPYKVDGGAVQKDGCAAEFNIDPANNYREWSNNIHKVVGQMKKMLPKGFTLRAVPSVIFMDDQWEAVDPADKALGCDPDFNAWTQTVNPPPERPMPSMCCAGGHLHIGFTKDANVADPEHILLGYDLVKQLDWYLGAWSHTKDRDPWRRQLYGKTGACRTKSYGVEYRTLSNFWVLEEKLRLQVWNRMQQAMWDMADNYIPDINPRACNTMREYVDCNIPFGSRILEDWRFPIVRIA